MSAAKPTAGDWMFQGIHPFSTPDGKFLNWSAFRISARSLDQADTDYYFIGTVSNVNDAPENEANARLICEAKNLLAALTQLAFMARTSGSPTPELLRACEGAEALIAKTGGCHG